jgi:hypothetical protein
MVVRCVRWSATALVDPTAHGKEGGEGTILQRRGTKQGRSSPCNRGGDGSKSGEDGGAEKMGPREERKVVWCFDWVYFVWMKGEAGGTRVVYGRGGALPQADKVEGCGWEWAWGRRPDGR